MNFSELKAEFFDRGFNYLEEDASDVARAERWLNQAYREILNLQAWPFLQATVTGASGAGFANVPDLRRVRYVTDVSQTSGTAPGRQLVRVSLDDLVAEGYDLTSTGAPDYYYIVGGNAVYGYRLGGTIRVDYFKRVAPMSGTDEPVFDEEYHNLIVDKAVIKAYIDSDNFEGAQALQATTDAGLSAMAEDFQIESRDLQFIRVDPYDG